MFRRVVQRDRPPPAVEGGRRPERETRRRRGSRRRRALLAGVLGRAQLDALATAGQGLDSTGLGVAAEQDVGGAGQLAGRDHARLLEQAVVAGHHAALRHEGDLRAGRQVQAGLDDAVVTQRDPETRVRPQQAALAQGHALAPAAREHAHRGGAAAEGST